MNVSALERNLLKRHIFVECVGCDWIGRGIWNDDKVSAIGLVNCPRCDSSSFQEITADRLDAYYADGGDGDEGSEE